MSGDNKMDYAKAVDDYFEYTRWAQRLTFDGQVAGEAMC